MHCEFLTIFPEIIRAYFSLGILRRAVEKDIVRYRVHDLRDFTKDRHRTVDDYPYGGGPGMVMKPEPFYSAVRSVTADGIATCPILLSPQGKVFDQKMAGELSRESRRLLFICGRYEGIDDRVRDGLAEHEISVGDYVLTGPARLQDPAAGHEVSHDLRGQVIRRVDAIVAPAWGQRAALFDLRFNVHLFGGPLSETGPQHCSGDRTDSTALPAE